MKTAFKIFVIIGTRPEAIKMAPLINILKSEKNIALTVCSSGQQKQLLNQTLKHFSIKPDIFFNVMTKKQSLNDVTYKIIRKLNKHLDDNHYDLALVHGDTTTAMAASIAFFNKKIDVGHVEAGLRTKSILSPYPEEFNRRIISVSSKYNFAPTKLSYQNLVNEGVLKKNIYITGNTIVDAIKISVDELQKNYIKKNMIHIELSKILNFDILNNKYILVTGHRRENFGDGIESICKSLLQLSKMNDDFYFVYPVHLNPNILQPVNKILKNNKRIKLISPLGYYQFILLMQHCFLILTDSGGIQEEGPTIGKPVLVMRDKTERPEVILSGSAKLVGSSTNKIVKNVQELISSDNKYKKMIKAKNPYGNGKAALNIVNIIKKENKL
jgi:UDP-N-acetylglucosamine 2-epimerase (non-hydrolysing)